MDSEQDAIKTLSERMGVLARRQELWMVRESQGVEEKKMRSKDASGKTAKEIFNLTSGYDSMLNTHINSRPQDAQGALENGRIELMRSRPFTRLDYQVAGASKPMSPIESVHTVSPRSPSGTGSAYLDLSKYSRCDELWPRHWPQDIGCCHNRRQ